jgi:putative DNA primase/helicase
VAEGSLTGESSQRGSALSLSANGAEPVKTPLQLVYARPEAKGCKKGSGQDWQCPAHNDEDPSLGVKEAVGGKVLLNCQAGCPTEQVVKELDLTMADLFPKKQPEVVYSYYDEEGSLLYQHVKTASGKRYSRRPADAYAFSVNGEPAGKWENNLNGVRRVLFNLPRVVEAVKRGETIYVAEGEKDAGNLMALAGVTATTNLNGAGQWKDEYSPVLRGANVVVVADRDEPGYAHARAVAKSLQGIAASVRIVLPAIDKHKADASDHLEAGLGVEDFQPLEDDQD